MSTFYMRTFLHADITFHLLSINSDTVTTIGQWSFVFSQSPNANYVFGIIMKYMLPDCIFYTCKLW